MIVFFSRKSTRRCVITCVSSETMRAIVSHFISNNCNHSVMIQRPLSVTQKALTRFRRCCRSCTRVTLHTLFAKSIDVQELRQQANCLLCDLTLLWSVRCLPSGQNSCSSMPSRESVRLEPRFSSRRETRTHTCELRSS